MAVLTKGARVTGAERTKLAIDLKKQYDKGKSIRQLADSHGRYVAGAEHDALEGAPPLGHEGEASLAQAAQRAEQFVAGPGVRIEYLAACGFFTRT